MAFYTHHILLAIITPDARHPLLPGNIPAAMVVSEHTDGRAIIKNFQAEDEQLLQLSLTATGYYWVETGGPGKATWRLAEVGYTYFIQRFLY